MQSALTSDRKPLPLYPTATELQRASGLPLTTCWRWIKGYARPSKLAAARLAAAGIIFEPPARRRDPYEVRRRAQLRPKKARRT